RNSLLLLRSLVISAGPILFLHAAVAGAVVHEVTAQEREPTPRVLLGQREQLVLVRVDDFFFPSALQAERNQVQIIGRELEAAQVVRPSLFRALQAAQCVA